jgi:hypothetical protein
MFATEALVAEVNVIVPARVAEVALMRVAVTALDADVAVPVEAATVPDTVKSEFAVMSVPVTVSENGAVQVRMPVLVATPLAVPLLADRTVTEPVAVPAVPELYTPPVKAGVVAALAGATDVITPIDIAATATSEIRLKVVFVDMFFLSLVELRTIRTSAWTEMSPS